MPPDAQAAASAALRPYRDAYPQPRWLDPSSWHATLLFIGSVPSESLDALGTMIDDQATELDPIELRISGGGGRLQHGAGVGWLEIDAGAGRVIELADRLLERSRMTPLGGPDPKRTPAAHVTVVRKADAEVIAALREQRRGPLTLTWTADRIALVRSHLSAGGARYETLHEARCTLPISDTSSRQ